MFFEESTAERIVRQYLIPWFVPRLAGRVRTYSARSLSEVVPRFADFNDLFVFLHLEPSYKNRVWVVVDGGTEEAGIVDQLRKKYTPAGWHADRFRQLERHDFEQYYPPPFSEETAQVLGSQDKQTRRQEKKALFNRLVKWIGEDEARARSAFAASAAEIITLLQKVEGVIIQ